VACDLQRPAAVNQLQVVGERAGVPVFAPHPGESPGSGPGDPVAVATAGLAEARAKHHDVVIVDTAGRLGIDDELMGQAAAIRDAVDPDEVIFVLDSMIGQDAVSTAQAFLDGVGFDGVVLTKLDGDARGGAALSIHGVTGVPIVYVGVGEKVEALEPFDPVRMAGRILGQGDVVGLVEKAAAAIDLKAAQKLEQKARSKRGMDLADFLVALKQMQAMGPMKQVLGLLPGVNAKALKQVPADDKRLKHVEAIVLSMTPAERADPSILNGSRRIRIAKGSGTSVQEVNRLLEQFQQMRKLIKRM